MPSVKIAFWQASVYTELKGKKEVWILATQPLLGLHHVTAMASDVNATFHLLTQVLGMRLIKRTVNYDQPNTYHFYFTDVAGTPGTDLTFFFFPHQSRAIRGTNMIAKISLRVPDDQALLRWIQRLADAGIDATRIEQFGDAGLEFVDHDGQVYQLLSDAHDLTPARSQPWPDGPVDDDMAIGGLGPITLNVVNAEHLAYVLSEILGFHLLATEGSKQLFALGACGHSRQVIVDEQPHLPLAKAGYGMGHHVAFITQDLPHLQQWVAHLAQFDLSQSGVVDRFYFQSDYFRPSPQLLFELATQGPGFFQDEPQASAGSQLVLPPFLTAQRQQILSGLAPLSIGGRHDDL